MHRYPGQTRSGQGAGKSFLRLVPRSLGLGQLGHHPRVLEYKPQVCRSANHLPSGSDADPSGKRNIIELESLCGFGYCCGVVSLLVECLPCFLETSWRRRASFWVYGMTLRAGCFVSTAADETETPWYCVLSVFPMSFEY